MTPDSLARALEAEQRARRERWQAITVSARAGRMDSDEIALSVLASGPADYDAIASHIFAPHGATSANWALAEAERGLGTDFEAWLAPHCREPGQGSGAVLVRKQRSIRETTPEVVTELLAAPASAGLTSSLPSDDFDALAAEIDFAGIPIADSERRVGAAFLHAATR